MVQLEFADNAKATFGTGADFQIYQARSPVPSICKAILLVHLGYIQSIVTTQLAINQNGSVESYYDNII